MTRIDPYKDRMIGFGVCTGVGIMLSIGGTINCFFLNYTGLEPESSLKLIFLAFAVLYSLGTICSLIGTGFLRGPMKQLKAMTDPNRLIAVIMMFLMIGKCYQNDVIN